MRKYADLAVSAVVVLAVSPVLLALNLVGATTVSNPLVYRKSKNEALPFIPSKSESGSMVEHAR